MEAKVVGILYDRKVLEDAVRGLVGAGFEYKDISVAGRQYGETQAPTEKEIRLGIEENPPGEETVEGALAGGVLGGVAGLLIGLGGTVVPGLGVLVAAGPLAAALGGSAVGASAGGLIGTIRDLGLTDEQVEGFRQSIAAGGILIAVHTTQDRAEDAARVMRDHGVEDIHHMRKMDRQDY